MSSYFERPLLRLALAFLAGLTGAMAQAPFGLSPLVLVPVCTGFILSAVPQRRWGSFALGWVLGCGYFGLTLRWIIEPFQIEAQIYGWMAPFALVFLASGLALLWGAGFALAHRKGAFVLAACWSAAELVRAYLFTGFPWGGFPQALVDTPFARLLAFSGPHGITLVFLTLAAFAMRSRISALVVSAFVAVAGLSLQFSAPAPTAMTGKVIRIVQPNAPQHEKWDPEKGPIFVNRQLDFTAAPGAVDLVLWPETAIPYLASNAQVIFDFAAQAARGVPVMMGVQRDTEEGHYFNSAVLIDATGEVAARYDKHHLVPFGEYMPFPDVFRRLGVRGLAERASSGYSPGPGPQVLDLGAVGRALPLICYEAVFPQDARAPQRPDFLVQLTNDAWFGLDAGPQQHLAQARMRAIEQGLPLARSANTGISAMIDADGRILNQIALGAAGHVDAALPAARPPTLYSRTGDLPWALLIVVCVMGAIFAGRDRKRDSD